MNDGTCRSCGEPVRWVRMAKTGKANPLNPEPDPERGNLTIDPDGETAHWVGLGEGAPLYLSHFATCATASQHRKPR